jgi:hypothetical protein
MANDSAECHQLAEELCTEYGSVTLQPVQKFFYHTLYIVYRKQWENHVGRMGYDRWQTYAITNI